MPIPRKGGCVQVDPSMRRVAVGVYVTVDRHCEGGVHNVVSGPSRLSSLMLSPEMSLLLIAVRIVRPEVDVTD